MIEGRCHCCGDLLQTTMCLRCHTSTTCGCGVLIQCSCGNGDRDHTSFINPCPGTAKMYLTVNR